MATRFVFGETKSGMRAAGVSDRGLETNVLGCPHSCGWQPVASLVLAGRCAGLSANPSDPRGEARSPGELSFHTREGAVRQPCPGAAARSGVQRVRLGQLRVKPSIIWAHVLGVATMPLGHPF